MLFCRHGKWLTHQPSGTQWLFGWLFILFQVMPVAAQGPSVENHSAEAIATTFGFDQTRFDVSREGYLTLTWTPVDEASYVVTDQRGQVFYRGEFAKAFISGLPDGEHSFEVTAFDTEGERIVASAEPARVTVSHWSLVYALALFLTGFVVVSLLLVVLARGSRSVAGHSAAEDGDRR